MQTLMTIMMDKKKTGVSPDCRPLITRTFCQIRTEKNQVKEAYPLEIENYAQIWASFREGRVRED